MVKREKDDNGKDINRRFEKIVRENTPRIFKMIYNMVGDYELTRDLTQEVFKNAWEGFASFRGDASIYTWLYRIALNRVYQHRREMGRKAEIISLDEIEPQEDSITPEKVLLVKSDAEKLKELLAKIPDKFQSVIVLRYFEDFNYSRISRILDIPVGTVRSRLHRGLTKLKKLLRSEL